MAESPVDLSEFHQEKEFILTPGQCCGHLHSSHTRCRSCKTKTGNRKSKDNINPVRVTQMNINKNSQFDRESNDENCVQNTQTKPNDYEVKSLKHANDEKELIHKSSLITLHGEMMFMEEIECTNQKGEITVKTPPRNVQIRDLFCTTETWESGDVIREKKYTVLPSINHSGKTEDKHAISNTTGISYSISLSNQLDLFRDKTEQNAELFADYHVNTSKVKATPRQKPLPPIKALSS